MSLFFFVAPSLGGVDEMRESKCIQTYYDICVRYMYDLLRPAYKIYKSQVETDHADMEMLENLPEGLGCWVHFHPQNGSSFSCFKVSWQTGVHIVSKLLPSTIKVLYIFETHHDSPQTNHASNQHQVPCQGLKNQLSCTKSNIAMLMRHLYAGKIWIRLVVPRKWGPHRRTGRQAKKFVTVGSLFTLNLWQGNLIEQWTNPGC